MNLIKATGVSLALSCISMSAQNAPLDRSVLPIAEPSYPHITELDARNAKAPARFEVTAPAGAPNVLIILIDDMGFGQSSAFGGPVQMPNAERLAANGLRYTNFHTTALCSPAAIQPSLPSLICLRRVETKRALHQEFHDHIQFCSSDRTPRCSAREFFLAPFMIHELLPTLTETAFGSHPRCVVSISYDEPKSFHGEVDCEH